MGATTEALANPWMPYLLLGVAALLTVVTLGVQVRRLPVALQGAWRGFDPRSSPGPALLLLASSAGMGSVAGAAIAVQAGGPGALPWMWIATLLGMALHFADASLAARPGPEHRPRTVPIMRAVPGVFGKILGGWFVLALLAVAIIVGGLFQSHEGAALLEPSLGLGLRDGAMLLAALAVPFAWVPVARRILVRALVPLTLTLYLVAAAIIVLEDPWLAQLALGDAWNEAFGLGSAAAGVAGGTVAVALHHGVTRAIMAGELGLGSAGLCSEPSSTPTKTGAAAMLVPLVVSGIVATMSGLVVTTSPRARDTTPLTEPDLVPLERAETRGLQPHLQAGQLIILPTETPLQAEAFYAMRLRSHPRGHRLAQMLASENAVLLPAWRVAETTDTVTFRHRENAKATRASWDVRVAVDREVIDGKGGPDLVKLTPKDPSIAFTKLVAYYELDPQPYVVLDDFDFVGRVGRAKSPDPQLGDHLAMYEAVGTDRPANPRLHEFFRQGYRGPYAADDGPRPPWGFVAREDFDRPVGAVVRLRLKADPRGNDFVHINRTGGAEVPPWDFMLDVNTLVIRHESDASKDLLLQVEPEHDGSRVRLEPVDESWADFRRLAKMNEYSGPFVRVPDQFFAAEVHSDTRVSKAFEGRRTLVPLHPLGQAQGPFGTLPYRPHPSELLDFGMTGPYLGEEGGTLVASRFEQVGPRWGAIVIGWVGLVFAISSIALWSEYAARALGAVLGGFAGTVGKVAVLIAAAMGGTLALPAVLGWSDAALAAAILPNLVALVIALPALRALMNSEQRGDGPS